MAVVRLPLTISEGDFQTWVMDLAVRLGWRIVHIPTVKVKQGEREFHTTTYKGHPGLPDLILARGGKVLLAELKRAHGTLRPAQHEWAAALGDNFRLWRPQDAQRILEELRSA